MPNGSRLVAAFCCALAAAGTVSGGASAQDRYPATGYSRIANAGPACRPMCSWDYAPCDPVYFKVADGRCKNPGRK